METTIQDIEDAQVDAKLDAELRRLLAACFLKDEAIFSEHRHYRQPPVHRWLVRNATGRLVAHACIHDKRLGTMEGDIHIGGVAEVCVHPDFRGQGLVRLMMENLGRWLDERDFEFSVLFGKTEVYSSSGYVNVDNPFRQMDWQTKQYIVRPIGSAMVLSLKDKKWPPGEIDLRGPVF